VVVENGVATITLNLKQDEEFAQHLAQEIEERISPLWDIEKVEVKYS